MTLGETLTRWAGRLHPALVSLTLGIAGCLAPFASLTAADGQPPSTTPAPAQPAPAQPAGSSTQAPAENPENAPAKQPDTQPTAKIILLTGYEPFGGAKVNPSWEAVKEFDGKEIHGYKIVARQLPVIWGAPLPALKKYMAELKPVAVLSFGQGRPDGFYMESLARNARGPFADNDGKKPSVVKIAEGPAQYTSSTLVSQIEQSLQKQGWPIVLSKDAGQYLCEECLYSLEHLKATLFKDTHVQFCHIPAWGNKVGKDKTEVTPELLKKFVGDMLETWYTQSQPEKHGE